MCAGSWWPEEGSRGPVLAFFTYSFEKTESLAGCRPRLASGKSQWSACLCLPVFCVDVGIRAQALVLGRKHACPLSQLSSPQSILFKMVFLSLAAVRNKSEHLGRTGFQLCPSSHLSAAFHLPDLCFVIHISATSIPSGSLFSICNAH